MERRFETEQKMRLRIESILLIAKDAEDAEIKVDHPPRACRL